MPSLPRLLLADRIKDRAGSFLAPLMPALARHYDLRFTTAGGRVETARGPLPLGHAFVLGQNELRFLARASERPPGAIEISLQTCSFP